MNSSPRMQLSGRDRYQLTSVLTTTTTTTTTHKTTKKYAYTDTHALADSTFLYMYIALSVYIYQTCTHAQTHTAFHTPARPHVHSRPIVLLAQQQFWRSIPQGDDTISVETATGWRGRGDMTWQTQESEDGAQESSPLVISMVESGQAKVPQL